MTHKEFIAWESASCDTIDVKRCYVDLARGDLVAGILLSQIIFWHLPAKNGAVDKLMIVKDGKKWLAKCRADWWEECRITSKQYDRAAGILEGIGVIETRTMRFGGSTTKHIRVCWDVFLRELALISMRVQGENLDIPQRSKTNSPEEKEQPSYSGKIQFDETDKSLTESTTETTAKTTTENLPLPQTPSPASTAGEEKEDLSSASDVNEEFKNENISDEHQQRVEDMLDKISKITKTTIELEKLRPLVLDCILKGHEDAWVHTLSVMTTKMAETVKPKLLNRFAATVLENALKSPVHKEVKSKSAPPPVEAPKPPVEAAKPSTSPVDAPAAWAVRKARIELSGEGAAAFKAKHGRVSSEDDWAARAREIEAAGENPA